MKESLPDMLAYIAFMAFLIWLRPPMYVTALLVTFYILAKMLWHKQFKLAAFLKACSFVYIFLGIIYSIYHFIGGTWALVLAHIFGVGAVIISRWRFIKKCDQQIKAQMDVIIQKQKGDTNGKESKRR